MRLLVATTNPGKIGEYQALLDGLNLQVVGLRQVEIDFDVEETGASFEENAPIKARAYADASGLLTLADDSGLCVDALDGAPGIYSARYGPTEHARIERLLGELQGVPDERRTARFGCVVALAEPGAAIWTFEGVCEGRIAWQPSGTNGFGYDPVFLFPEYGQTMAELPAAVKNQVSHRARAMTKAREWLLARTSARGAR
ncbi:MAG TPA: RdgB/HAM1 family non-canonical purine NTP pyrophosphatase [Anaerolineae bacterium]